MGVPGRQVALCVDHRPLGDGVQRRPEVAILFDERENQLTQGPEGGLNVDQRPTGREAGQGARPTVRGRGHRVHLRVPLAGIAGLAIGARLQAQTGVAGVGRGFGL